MKTFYTALLMHIPGFKELTQVHPIMVTIADVKYRSLDPIDFCLRGDRNAPRVSMSVHSFPLDPVGAELVCASEIMFIYPTGHGAGVGPIPVGRHALPGPAVVCRKFNGWYEGFPCQPELLKMVLGRILDESYNLTLGLQDTEPVVEAASADIAAMLAATLKKNPTDEMDS